MDKMGVRAYVGRRVSEARDLAGLRQEALAKSLGITATALSMVETGRNALTVERLIEIAALTGRAVTWFLPGGAAPDAAAALQAAFPGITEGQVLGVLDFARYLRSPESRIRADDGGSGR